MTAVLVLGSGMTVRPLVDYLLDSCRLSVMLTDPSIHEAARIIGRRPGGAATAWTAGDVTLLHRLVQDADIVVSMLPPELHPEVAQACFTHRRHLVTTSYISQSMAALDGEARERGLLFLNEMGESPGLDHMSAMALLADARGRGEEIIELYSYAGGLPAPHWNTNPWGYKFSWSPRGVFKAAQSSAVHLERGNRITVPPESLFERPRMVQIQGAGTFETYPNRDATRYRPYGLDPEVTFYRGLLRTPGWCATMRALRTLGFLDDLVRHELRGLTHAEFLADLLGCRVESLSRWVAEALHVAPSDPVIHRLEWLGLFGSTVVGRSEGSALDVLLDLAVERLAYNPGEQDMVVVHNVVVGRGRGGIMRHTATLVAEGIPDGDSAMARAVGLTAGIATRLVVEGRIGLHGVTGPWHDEVFNPILHEMASRGFAFRHSSTLEP